MHAARHFSFVFTILSEVVKYCGLVIKIELGDSVSLVDIDRSMFSFFLEEV